jgi:hypothetical protein
MADLRRRPRRPPALTGLSELFRSYRAGVDQSRGSQSESDAAGRLPLGLGLRAKW